VILEPFRIKRLTVSITVLLSIPSPPFLTRLLASSAGLPASSLTDGLATYNYALSYMPGQRLSACTCSGDSSHPGPKKDGVWGEFCFPPFSFPSSSRPDFLAFCFLVFTFKSVEEHQVRTSALHRTSEISFDADHPFPFLLLLHKKSTCLKLKSTSPRKPDIFR